MSVSIHVQVNRPMSLSDIAEGSSSALQELLNLRHRQPIESALNEVRPNASEDNCLTEGAPLVICTIAEAEEAARVLPVMVPTCEQLATGEWIQSGERLLASIQPHSSHSSLCWALTAAVAIAIARASSSEIEDGASFFTTACDGVDPELFIKSVGVVETYDELQTAAEVLYGGMNKSAEVAQWVREGRPGR